MRFMFFLFLLAVFSAHASEIYKCSQPDGSVKFSDAPCGKDAKTVKVDVAKKAPMQKWCRDSETPSEKLIGECLDSWKPTLRNPKAAYSESAIIGFLSKSKKRTLFVDARAQNGFGGMNAMQLKCAVTGTGEIDSSGTLEEIKLYGALNNLNVKPVEVVPETCEE